MKKRPTLVLVLILICINLSACTFYAKKFGFRYKKPKVEAYANIEKTWREVSAKHSTYFVAADWSANESDSVRNAKIYRAMLFRNYLTNGLCLFDKNGHQLDLYGEKVCTGKLNDFIPRLKGGIEYDSLDNLYLQKYLNVIVDKNSQNMAIEGVIKAADFYAIIPWSNWLGNTKREARDVLKLLDKRSDLNIIFIPVNCDVLETWQGAEEIANSFTMRFKRAR